MDEARGTLSYSKSAGGKKKTPSIVLPIADITKIEPVAEGRILHRFLESANVETVLQVARMVEVQRAYEMGQSFLDAEDNRMREAMRAFTRR